jgi:hypothetical protein
MTSHQPCIERVGRRLFVRGAAGVLVGLPILETFQPRRASAQDLQHRYALFVRQGNGVQQGDVGGGNGGGGDYGSEPDRFWPTKLGPLTTAAMQADGDQAVNVLAAHAEKLLIVRGLRYQDLGVDAGCGHSGGGLLCLTAAKANGHEIEKALAMGESIDNRIVRELQQPGDEPLTLRAGVRSSYLDDVLSYRGPTDRRTAQQNPYNAYTALFGMAEATPAGDEALAARRKSVNDYIRKELAVLLQNQKLSKDDRYRLEHHQQAIRDLETTLSCKLSPELLAVMSETGNDEATRDDRALDVAQMQMQTMALAVACGSTRAATLQIGNGNDQTQYTINGKKYERFHHISHRINGDGGEGSAIENADVKHHEVDKMFGQLFAYLIEQLSSYTTPTGTLLDEGASIWLSDVATGDHSGNNLPYVVAGSAGGYLRTGAYVDAAAGSGDNYLTHNRFLNTIGAAVGCKNQSGAPLDDFGDASLPRGLVEAMLA